MRIGLIDVDGHNYPNLALMKLAAWHWQQGDVVDWYHPLISGHVDKVYMSKVFSFSPDYMYYIDADEVVKGGTGYAIHTVDGHETMEHGADGSLPDEIEHIMPCYGMYKCTNAGYADDKAYGFLSRGCPRGCSFCHVAAKEGKCSRKVANLDEFWNGQKYLELLDPNLLACKDWKDLLEQVADSKAKVNFNQDLDIRVMTEEKADLLRRCKVEMIHFAWDRYEDGDKIKPKFEEFRKISKLRQRALSVYVLCGYDTTLEQDLERIYWLRDNGYTPFVMLYDKENIKKGSILRDLQGWVNNRYIFWKCDRFEDFNKNHKY